MLHSLFLKEDGRFLNIDILTKVDPSPEVEGQEEEQAFIVKLLEDIMSTRLIES